MLGVKFVKKWTMMTMFVIVTVSVFWGLEPTLLDPAKDNSILSFILIFIISFIFGELSTLIKIPKVVGMIISGILIANFNFGYLTFNSNLSDIIRNISLAILLLLAGFELDLPAIRSLSGIVLRLCFVPMIAEIIITSITGHYILNLPFVWSTMLGVILSAACAAIIVPVMINLKRNRLGVQHGIPTIITCACSLDDVFAIAGFGVILSFAFSEFEVNLDQDQNQDNQTMSHEEIPIGWKIAKAPLEVIIGIILGIIFGFFVSLNSNSQDQDKDLEDQNKDPEDQDKETLRFGLVLSGALSFVFVSNQLDYPGSGPLGVLIFSAIAGHRLRNNEHILSNIVSRLNFLWAIFSIFLFSLIGSDIKIDDIDADNIILILIVIIIGMICRIICTYGCLFGGNLNFKEKIYISITWLSKAAVQATVGPIALTVARSRCKLSACDEDSNQDIARGKVIITTCVIAVLICAPIGALAMEFMSSKLLSIDPILPEVDEESNKGR